MANADLQPIAAIAQKIGIPEADLESFGGYTAKVSLDRLPDPAAAPKGKLILVTGITPTSAGEGKTVTTIGLAQALAQLGRQAIATLREPSLGPVFGVKGGATGGGKSQVLPVEKINLHFNGDKHAVGAAHNLLAAMIDAHIFHGNELHFDPATISWPRVVDMNDRALRQIQTGLGGTANGTPRDARFVITAASEVMAILALSQSPADCARRLGAITVGFTSDGAPVQATDLAAVGANRGCGGREAQARPTFSVRRARPERDEEVVPECFRHAGALIEDVDREMGRPGVGARVQSGMDLDVPAVARLEDRVRQEVAEDLPDPELVYQDDRVLGVREHPDAARGGERPEPRHDALDELGQRHGPAKELAAGSVGLGELEQVRGQGRQAHGVRVSCLDRLAKGRRVVLVAGRQLQLGLERRDRRAQVVGRGRHEASLPLDALGDAIEKRVQRVRQLADLVVAVRDAEPALEVIHPDHVRLADHRRHGPKRAAGKPPAADHRRATGKNADSRDQHREIEEARLDLRDRPTCDDRRAAGPGDRLDRVGGAVRAEAKRLTADGGRGDTRRRVPALGDDGARAPEDGGPDPDPRRVGRVRSPAALGREADPDIFGAGAQCILRGASKHPPVLQPDDRPTHEEERHERGGVPERQAQPNAHATVATRVARGWTPSRSTGAGRRRYPTPRTVSIAGMPGPVPSLRRRERTYTSITFELPS